MSFGYHVSKHGRPLHTALEAAVVDLTGHGFAHPAAQIFVAGPQSFKPTADAAEIAACRHVIDANGVRVVIHGAYVDHPWKRSAASIHNIKQEMRVAAALGATGVIIHLAAGAADDGNLRHVLETVAADTLPGGANPILWLEIHTAKASPLTYETPEKLIRLFERVRAVAARRPDGAQLRVGLCIDTAHVFSCGVALTSVEVMGRWLGQLSALPAGTPIMVHLNDSASTIGSGKDIHAGLARGGIWGMYDPRAGLLPVAESGLMAILLWAEAGRHMVILERGDDDALRTDLTLVRGLGCFQN